MRKVYLLLVTIITSILVTLTYFYFELAVRKSINYVWDTLFNTADKRILVIPICLVLSLVFFGLQHFWDSESEKSEAKGLGDTPTPTVINFVKVIIIGFFSLVAGASLGPEAILVPACLVIGGYMATKLFNKDGEAHSILSVGAFAALFAAFFNSFVAGLLGMLLISKQLKIKLDATLMLAAVVASGVTVVALNILSSKPYTALPGSDEKITIAGVLSLPVLLVAGYLVTYLYSYAHSGLKPIRTKLKNMSWWLHGTIAAAVLSALYLMGGTLVEFTGNESVLPMLQKSAKLGLIGLAWVLIVKILAMAWSKSSGYRGGLIFPSILLASILVAMVQLYVKDTNFTVGLVAALVGILAANSKVKVLF